MNGDCNYSNLKKKTKTSGSFHLQKIKKPGGIKPGTKNPGPTNREMLIQLSKDIKEVKSNQQKDHKLLLKVIKVNKLKTK